MNVFEAFPESVIPCQFLVLSSGGARGNSIVEEFDITAILKERKGMSQNANIELKESTSTIHIRANEPFWSTINGDTDGHGIRATKNGSTVTYRIIGQPEGYDFEIGKVEFYRLLLKKESLAGS